MSFMAVVMLDGVGDVMAAAYSTQGLFTCGAVSWVPADMK
jgi:hypothetical protein